MFILDVVFLSGLFIGWKGKGWYDQAEAKGHWILQIFRKNKP